MKLRKMAKDSGKGKMPTSLLITHRPKRNVIQKTTTETAGLSWREETNLTKALYASLQDQNRTGTQSISPVDFRKWERSVSRDSIQSEKGTSSTGGVPPNSVDESSRDSTSSSLSKSKVHAQRKFAQGQSAPSSPSSTPVKFSLVTSSSSATKLDRATVPRKKITPIKKIPRSVTPVEVCPPKPHTEDFLTFLCFRGMKSLPPRYRVFETPDKCSDNRPDTPVSNSDSDSGMKSLVRSLSSTPVRKYKSPRHQRKSPPPSSTPIKPVPIHPPERKITPPPLLPIIPMKRMQSNGSKSGDSSTDDSPLTRLRANGRNSSSFKKYEKQNFSSVTDDWSEHVVKKTSPKVGRKRKVARDGLDMAKRRKRIKAKFIPLKKIVVVKQIVKQAIDKNADTYKPDALRIRSLRSHNLKKVEEHCTKQSRTRRLADRELRNRLSNQNKSGSVISKDQTHVEHTNFFEYAIDIHEKSLSPRESVEKDLPLSMYVNQLDSTKEVPCNEKKTNIKQLVKHHIISRQRNAGKYTDTSQQIQEESECGKSATTVTPKSSRKNKTKTAGKLTETKKSSKCKEANNETDMMNHASDSKSEEEIDFPNISVSSLNTGGSSEAVESVTNEDDSKSTTDKIEKKKGRTCKSAKNEKMDANQSESQLKSMMTKAKRKMPEGSIPALHDGKEVILVPISALPVTATINNITLVPSGVPGLKATPSGGRKKRNTGTLKRAAKSQEDLESKPKRRKKIETNVNNEERNKSTPCLSGETQALSSSTAANTEVNAEATSVTAETPKTSEKRRRKSKRDKDEISPQPVKKLPKPERPVEVVTGLCIDSLSPPLKKRGRPSAKIPKSEIQRRPYPSKGGTACIIEVPVYRPTAKEFQDPLLFVESIREEAELYGMARIVPPKDWKPDINISEEMKLPASLQYIHKMKDRWGPNVHTTECIRRHLASQGVKLDVPPHIGGIELDLARLYQTIKNFGGAQTVIEKKKWPQIANALGFPKQAVDRHTKLYEAYCKYLLTYDMLSADDKKQLEHEVESDIKAVTQREGKCIGKGKSLALGQLCKVARNLKAMYFKDKEEPAPEQVEYEYWKVVTERLTHTTVHYAHLDTQVVDSAFPAKKANYAKHSWNLNNVGKNKESILGCLGPVSDVTCTTLHIGMLFGTSTWSTDYHNMPSIHYSHVGSSIIWYCVPLSQADNLKEVLCREIPNSLQMDQSLWLPQDSAMISPNVLVEAGISVCRSVQHAGEFVIILPKAHTSHILCGYNVSETVPFATHKWLPSGLHATKILNKSNYAEKFSMERLLCTLAKQNNISTEKLMTVLPLLEQIIKEEISGRHKLVQAGLKMFEKMASSEDTPQKGLGSKSKRKISYLGIAEDEKNRCEVSKKICYFSMVVNDVEGEVYSLEHGWNHIQKKRNLKNCTLMYRYTEEEMWNMLEAVKQRIPNQSNILRMQEHL